MRPTAFALSLSTVFALSAVVSAHAGQGCKGGPRADWKSPELAKKAAIENGFTKVQKVILEDGCYEVVTLNDQGKIVGVHFDPVTLKLEKVEQPR